VFDPQVGFVIAQVFNDNIMLVGSLFSRDISVVMGRLLILDITEPFTLHFHVNFCIYFFM
jgi:hypothetical protein